MEHTSKEFVQERGPLSLARIVLTTRVLGKMITCGAMGGWLLRIPTTKDRSQTEWLMVMVPSRTHFWFTQENGDAISVMVQVNRLISKLGVTIKDNLSMTNIMAVVPLKNQISSLLGNSKTAFMTVRESWSIEMGKRLLESLRLGKSFKESMWCLTGATTRGSMKGVFPTVGENSDGWTE